MEFFIFLNDHISTINIFLTPLSFFACGWVWGSLHGKRIGWKDGDKRVAARDGLIEAQESLIAALCAMNTMRMGQIASLHGQLIQRDYHENH